MLRESQSRVLGRLQSAQAITSLLVLLACAALPARADDSAKHVVSPEIRKTVDAFVGAWLFDGTVTMPDGKVVKAPIRMSCRRVAGGKAVACELNGNIPGAGPYDASILAGFDTFNKNVHFMAMTSDEEVHDHVCHWSDATNLVCDRHHGGQMGEAITEDLAFVLSGNKGSFKSVVTAKDGSKLSFEAAGQRGR